MKKLNLKTRLVHYAELATILLIVSVVGVMSWFYRDNLRLRAEREKLIEINQSLGNFNDKSYTELLKATKDACEGKYVYLKVDELGEKEGKGK